MIFNFFRIPFYKLWIDSSYRRNNIQLLTGFEDNSSFVWPENGSVARIRRLRATDQFEGQTKLLLSEEPVYNCFVIHRHCDVNITWLIEPMKIRPSVNSTIAGNRSMNCWPVNRTVMQLIGILLLIVKMLCIYCIAFIKEIFFLSLSKN